MRLFYCVVLLLVTAAQSHASQQVSIDEFAAYPALEAVRISPDGTRIALISGTTQSARNLMVVSLEGEAPIVINASGEPYLTDLEWLSTGHLLLRYTSRVEYRGGYRHGRLADIERKVILRLADQSTHELGINEHVAATLPDDPDHILIRARIDRMASGAIDRSAMLDSGYALFRQSLSSGRRTRVLDGPADMHVLVNGAGEPVFRMRGGNRRISFSGQTYLDRGDSQITMWRRTEDQRWESVYEDIFDVSSRPDSPRYIRAYEFSVMTDVAGLSTDGRYAYFSTVTDGAAGQFRPGIRFAVYRFELSSGEMDGPIAQSDFVDVGRHDSDFIRDWRTNAILGVAWVEGRRKVMYFGDEFAELQAQLEAAFRGATVEFVSWSRTADRMVIHVDTPGADSGYYLFDRQAGTVELLGASRQLGAPIVRSTTRYMAFPVADGLELAGRLTIPSRGSDEAYPLIVQFADGRPGRSDTELEHFLADRGYAVLSLAYRGHADHGFAIWLAETGHGIDWLDSDLAVVIDAVSAEIAIDPDRICLLGWGFGGYLALSQTTSAGNRYHCAVSVGAYAYDDRVTERGFRILWRGAFPEQAVPERDISPAARADQATAPIMLVHCIDDIFVDHDHSVRMADALAEAGRPVEFQSLDCDISDYARMPVGPRIEFLTSLERFLGDMNGAQAEQAD